MAYRLLLVLFCAASLLPKLAAQIYKAPSGDPTFLGRPSALQAQLGGAVFLADVNGDGNLDLVVDNPIPASLDVLYGDGVGNFTQGPISPLSPDGGYISQLVDMNGDGILDYLYCEGLNEFYISYGNGDGTFQKTTTYPLHFPLSQNVENEYSFNIVAADFNGDGKIDVAVAGQFGWEVLLGTGSGFQVTAHYYPKNGNIDPGLAVGDINGDGKPDLVYSSSFAVQSFIGNGDGTFGPGTALNLPNPYPGRWSEVELADWSGDGKLGLLVNNQAGSFLYRLPSNGDGTFGVGIPMRLPYPSAQFQVADFNGDGIPDIQGAGGDHITVYSGKGGGQFAEPVSYPLDYYPGDTLASYEGAAIGSIRNNGRLDVVATVSDGVNILFNMGSRFEETPRLSAPGSAAFATADFNGDGHMDLVTVGSSGLEVFWGTGRAKQAFLAGPVSPEPGLNAAYLALGDFNGDGFLDVAVNVNTLTGQSTQVAVCLGDGAGHFGAPIYSSVGPLSLWIAAGDLNGDGKLDLVSSSMSILFGNGDGTFQSPISFGQPTNGPVRLKDLNGDGALDIFTTTNLVQNDIMIFFNNGNGTFLEPQFFPGSQNVYTVSCDVNGDGIPDIVSADGGPYPNVLLGNGNGTFFVPKTNDVSLRFTTSALACGDFTGSKTQPEIAMLSNYLAATEILKNIGEGEFSQISVGWGTGSGPLDIISGKFHEPSSVDDLVVLNGDGTISILLNLTKK